MKDDKKNKEQESENKEQISQDTGCENCEKYQKMADEWRQKYLRALADYENLERRVSSELESKEKRIKKSLIIPFLEVVDDLEMAEVFVKDQGLKLIKDKIEKMLVSHKVRELKLKGEEFDPYTGECIEVVEGDEDNKIVEVLRKGYELEGEVIRPARVRVTKRTKENSHTL